MFKKLIFFSLITICNLSFSKELPQDSVVIVGGGVGALTSAIYLARSGIKPIVIEGKVPGGALSLSPKVQNWPGEVEISGFDLMEKIHKQAERNGVIFVNQEVESIDFSKRPFKIFTQDVFTGKGKNTLEASSIVLATGSEPSRLHVKGESEFWLKGVYACAVCDGALYKDKVVAVIGGGDAALSDAQYLSQIAKKVYVVVRKDSLKANEKIREAKLHNTKNVEFIFGAQVKEIKGSKKGVSDVVFVKEGSDHSVGVDAIFLAIGAKPNTQMFLSQLKASEEGYISVNERFETSISGVFAIGDIVDPFYKQAISAAGDGAKAALEVANYLSLQGVSYEEAKPIAIKKEEPAVVKQELALETSSSNSVIEIKSYEQLVKEIQTANMPVLIDFYAAWCGPCRHLKPVLDSYAKTLQGKVKILKIDVHSNKDLANIYSVRSMPSMIILDKNGEQKGKKEGVSEIIYYLSTL